MGKENTIQHYVPKCYLKNWVFNDKEQVYVYDRISKKIYSPNIQGIASERFFYDCDIKALLTQERIDEILSTVDPKLLDNEHFIEKYLADYVEDEFKRLIQTIIQKASTMNNWEAENCYCIKEEIKEAFSYHLAILSVRLKSVRDDLLETNTLIEKLLSENNASEQTIANYRVDESDLAAIQGSMILNKENLATIAEGFYNLTWVVLLNQTSSPFVTSDNPICRRAHVTHPFLSMAGLNSPGVEVFFPLSPDVLLLMYDGEYHKYKSGHDRALRKVVLLDNIDYYNSCEFFNSNRWTISSENDFSLIEKLVAKNPELLDKKPHIEISYGGKTYTS